MKRIYLFHCIMIILALQITSVTGKNMISMFIRTFPGKYEISFPEILAKTRLHGRISYKILKEALSKHTYEGVLATYYGFVTPSDVNGQIVFPRKTQKNSVKLLITPMIEPIMMIDATVHHWETLPTLPARLYSLERKQDEGTGAYYWDAKETNLPQNRHVSLETIVLFADPTNILVPTGITLTTKSPHLILPNIYAKKDLNIAVNALRVLKIKHFFSPVLSEVKKQTDTYYSRQW